MKKSSKFAVWLLAASVFVPVAGAQNKSHRSTPSKGYQVTDLGTLGGSFSQANGINDFNQVVGSASTTSDTSTHAFLWTKKGGIQDLGTLAGGTNSSAQGINDNITDNGIGHVAGSSDFNDPVNGLVTHAFIFKKGAISDLGTLGGVNAGANGFNLFGAAGFSFLTGNFAQHATLWTSNGPQDLGTLGGVNSQGFGVSAFNQVVGSSDTATGSTDAFLFNPKTKTLTDLGTLGGLNSQASAISLLGQQVTGFSTLAGEAVTHAFLFAKGTMKDIGSLGGTFAQGNGVDDFGDAVGSSNTTNDADVHAFIFTQKGGLQDLNTLIPTNSGWDLNSAQAINDGGYIVGAGVLNGQTHGFLLTPNRK
jgi:probable HAF family extracellular repeat protein